MEPFILGFALVALLIIVSMFARTFSAAHRQRVAERKSRSLGVEVIPGSASAIQPRLITVTRGSLAGAALGLVGSTLVTLTLPNETGAGGWVVVGATLVGLAVGVIATTLVLETQRTASDVRVARATRVSLGDYVGVPFRIVTWAMLAFTAVVAIGSRLLVLDYGVSKYMPESYAVAGFAAIDAVAVCGTASMLLLEIAGRILIAKGQPVGTTSELALDDALRANALWGIMYAPPLCGVYTAMIAANVFQTINLSESTRQTLDLVTYGIIVAVLIVDVVVGGFSPQRRYLQRLWPELAAARLDHDAYWAEVAEHEAMNARRNRLRKAAQ